MAARLHSLAVREGIYLFEHGIDPYSGGAFRHVRDHKWVVSLLLTLSQSPLLLSLFSTALPLTRYTSPVLWAAADSITAWALVRIWRLRTGAKSTSRDWQVAALYVHSSHHAAFRSSSPLAIYTIHISYSLVWRSRRLRSRMPFLFFLSCVRPVVSGSIPFRHVVGLLIPPQVERRHRSSPLQLSSTSLYHQYYSLFLSCS